MNRINAVLSLLAVLVAGLAHGVQARPLKICLTGSTEGIIPTYGEAFKNGALLAVEEMRDSAKSLQAEVQTHFYEATPLASARATERMIADGCAVLIGYSTMNELLGAQEVARKNPIPILSIYGERDERFKDTPYVMTLQPSATYLVNRFAPYLRALVKGAKKRKALILTAVDHQGVLEYKERYQQLLKKWGYKVETLDFLERLFDTEALRRERSTKLLDYDVVFLLARSVNAANFTDLLTELGAKPNRPLLVGTKNLGSAQLPALLDRLKHKDVSVYFPRYSCTTETRNRYPEFVARYRKRFEKEPMIISGETYDAVGYVMAAAKKLSNVGNGPIGRQELLTALGTVRFHGITGTRFQPGFQTKYDGHFFIHVTKDGYTDVTHKRPSTLAE